MHENSVQQLRGHKKMKFPLPVCRLLCNTLRQKDPLFTAELLLIYIKLVNPWFGKIMSLGHLERFGAQHEGHDTVSGTLHWALPRARHSHSGRDFHTPVAESSSGPSLLTISGGLGKRLTERGWVSGVSYHVAFITSDHLGFSRLISHLLCYTVLLLSQFLKTDVDWNQME